MKLNSNAKSTSFRFPKNKPTQHAVLDYFIGSEEKANKTDGFNKVHNQSIKGIEAEYYQMPIEINLIVKASKFKKNQEIRRTSMPKRIG